MHHGRGMPYYGYYGYYSASHWDRGVKSMPEDTLRVPQEYRHILKWEANERFIKCATRIMRHQGPDINKDDAEYSVHRYLASNGAPKGDWEGDLLKYIWAEYAKGCQTDILPDLDPSDGSGPCTDTPTT